MSFIILLAGGSLPVYGQVLIYNDGILEKTIEGKFIKVEETNNGNNQSNQFTESSLMSTETIIGNNQSNQFTESALTSTITNTVA